MQLLFHSRDRDAHALRDWAVERARFALRRLAGRVARTTIRLADQDGARHGVDKRCTVEIVATDGKPVVVTAIARDWRESLSLALQRAVEALKRVWMRRLAGRRALRAAAQEPLAAGGTRPETRGLRDAQVRPLPG